MIDALDAFGLPIRVQRPGSASAVAGFQRGFLAYTPEILPSGLHPFGLCLSFST
jgi:hypothetical protein